MKVLIVVTMTNNFGKKGSYNSQEIGLARGLAQLGHKVIVYKCVVDENEIGEEDIVPEVASVRYTLCKHVGSNGYLPVEILDNTADVLIQFSDVQLSVPSIYKWCKKNRVAYLPYVGITWSQSKNKYVRFFIERMAKRNFRIYRENGCIAKNQKAYVELEKLGVTIKKIAPVCIDLEQVKKDYTSISTKELREKWDYSISDKIYLFIGRFEKDKRPIDAIKIFSTISDDNAKLIMVGKGELLEEIQIEIKRLCLSNKVRIINYIPNSEVWQLYRLSDVFLNLNKTEIWGMVLLEAMYYKLGIIAVSAPGPDTIIENNKTGYIVYNDKELEDKLSTAVFSEEMLNAAFERVTKIFNWKNTAKEMLRFIEENHV